MSSIAHLQQQQQQQQQQQNSLYSASSGFAVPTSSFAHNTSMADYQQQSRFSSISPTQPVQNVPVSNTSPYNQDAYPQGYWDQGNSGYSNNFNIIQNQQHSAASSHEQQHQQQTGIEMSHPPGTIINNFGSFVSHDGDSVSPPPQSLSHQVNINSSIATILPQMTAALHHKEPVKVERVEKLQPSIPTHSMILEDHRSRSSTSSMGSMLDQGFVISPGKFYQEFGGISPLK